MKKLNQGHPTRLFIIRAIRNVCLFIFVFSVILFSVVAITYQSYDQFPSSKPPTKIFASLENATFQNFTAATTNTTAAAAVLTTNVGTDTVPLARIDGSPSPVNDSQNVTLMPGCGDVQFVNCSDPRVLITIQSFNLRTFKAMEFLEYKIPVNGRSRDECDVIWKFKSRKEKPSWRKYRDFRRYKMGYNDDCSYKVVNHGRWHSGLNAFPSRTQASINGSHQKVKIDTAVQDDKINGMSPSRLDSAFGNGRYLYYSRGGDYCKDMNQYTWSFLCGLGEAMYLNRTFVFDLSICLASTYTRSNKVEEGTDFRFYFDFEHLQEMTSVMDEIQFVREWKRWDKRHKRKISVRQVGNHRVTPLQLRREKSTIIWRQFDSPEPQNYWFQICDGPAAKYIRRPWDVLHKSKILRNIADEISASMDWDYDAVHVVRGEKARNKERWPHLDADTFPANLVAKLQGTIAPWRHLYIATNEPSYNFFDELRSHYKVHLLDDYQYLWGKTSQWYNDTTLLNGGHPVEFDGYMRVVVDTEVLYRSKTRVETFYNLTKDCKDGINTC